MVYIYLFLIIFTLGILFFYTKEIKSSIRFKRKNNIKTNNSSVEIITDIAVYTLSVINISICVWALLGII